MKMTTSLLTTTTRSDHVTRTYRINSFGGVNLLKAGHLDGLYSVSFTLSYPNKGYFTVN